MLRFYLAMARHDPNYWRYWPYFLTDGLAAAIAQPKPNPDKLLLCRLDQLGDLVVTMHLRKQLEQELGFDGKDCILVHNPALTPFVPLLFPNWQSIQVTRKKLKWRPLYRIKTLAKIRRLGAKIAIVPGIWLSFSTHISLIMASAAQECHMNAPRASHPYRHVAKLHIHTIQTAPHETLKPLGFNDDNHTIHEMTRQFFMLSQITGKTIPPILDTITAKILPNINKHNNAILLKIGAFKSQRSWPLSFWILLAKDLAERGFHPIFLAGSNEPNTKNQLDALTDKSGFNFPYGLEQSPTPTRLLSLIASTTALISNDTGIAHLAIALHKPLIVIRRGGLDHLPSHQRRHISRKGEFFPYPNQLAHNIARIIDRPDIEFQTPRLATQAAVFPITQTLQDLIKT